MSKNDDEQRWRHGKGCIKFFQKVYSPSFYWNGLNWFVYQSDPTLNICKCCILAVDAVRWIECHILCGKILAQSIDKYVYSFWNRMVSRANILIHIEMADHIYIQTSLHATLSNHNRIRFTVLADVIVARCLSVAF